MNIRFYLFIYIFAIFFSFNVNSITLTSDELIFFNFIDFNNDKKISYDEADNILKIIFNLLDKNNDKFIDEKELIDLKNIIENLK